MDGKHSDSSPGDRGGLTLSKGGAYGTAPRMTAEKMSISGTSAHGPAATLLERVLACPSCHGAELALGPLGAECRTCGRKGTAFDGVLDFVPEQALSERDREELAAQANAVDKYYENEEKLSCHWDRSSADDLTRMVEPHGKLVLDLGCGTASAGAAFVRAGAMVLGCDLSRSCLAVARTRLDGVVRADAKELPFRDACFDVVVARGALHHMAEPELAVREVRRVLKPGGTAIFADPREFAWLEPVKHALRKNDDSFSHDHHAYPADEYSALIARELDVEEARAWYPLGILATVGLDLLPLPRLLPKRAIANAFLGLDRRLTRTPLGGAGQLLVVKARRRA
jgi:ubiquinone/menaquinone biosynthesis C-methylase UbiE